MTNTKTHSRLHRCANMHERYPGNTVGTLTQPSLSLLFCCDIIEIKHHVLLHVGRFSSVIKAACAFKLCVYLEDITLHTAQLR